MIGFVLYVFRNVGHVASCKMLTPTKPAEKMYLNDNDLNQYIHTHFLLQVICILLGSVQLGLPCLQLDKQAEVSEMQLLQ